MRSCRVVGNIKTQFYVQYFSFENRAVYEMMWRKHKMHGYAKTPQYYIIATLPVFPCFFCQHLKNRSSVHCSFCHSFIRHCWHEMPFTEVQATFLFPRHILDSVANEHPLLSKKYFSQALTTLSVWEVTHAAPISRSSTDKTMHSSCLSEPYFPALGSEISGSLCTLLLRQESRLTFVDPIVTKAVVQLDSVHRLTET